MDHPMSDNSDRPFGHDTLKIRAVFVPEGAEDQFSRGDIIGAVGYDSVKVPAVFVPEGGTPPSHPYENFGKAEFRPDQDAGPQQITASWQSAAPRDSESQPEQAASPPTPPPTPAPALALQQGKPFAAGLAAWRSTADPGKVWRKKRAAPDSAEAEPHDGEDTATLAQTQGGT
jgi:hypothetical protein